MPEELTSTEEKNNEKADAIIPTWDSRVSDHSDFTTTDVAAAKLEKELSQALSLLDDHRMQEDSDIPTCYFKVAGVLRYSRESDNRVLDSRTILPASQHLTESPVKCEYCGEKARPSLDLTWVEQPEIATTTLFCCAQHQQLCEMLAYQRHLVLVRCDLGTDTPTPLDNKPTPELEELFYQGRVMEECRKQEQERAYHDNATHRPVAETYIPASKILSYQLSTCAPGKGRWTVPLGPENEKGLKIKGEEAEVVVPYCGHKPFQFGISHHQDGAGFLQKYYSNGMKFLTVFPDGSAQVFYPSGHLALVVVVTEEKGRICIVYDDSHVPERPIRAVFQSDGRATCYHSNGNIWLSLDRLGGQCLDDAGARVQRWSWSSLKLTPTPLRPVFLSLNRMVGVRILGQKQVFVSFLACGQQAKFSLGACCVQVECKRDRPAEGPSITKEELFLLAGRIRVHLAIKCLHQCLKTPSNLQPLRATLAPRLCIIRRLLDVSEIVHMSERERAFIHGCLRDCLM